MTANAGTEPVLTVVIPAYNEAEILSDTIAEVTKGLHERDEPFEVIVVENGSTDSTRQLAYQLAEQYPELVVETHDVANYGGALRHGLLHARGEIVVNFDCDYYDLDFLERAVATMRADAPPAAAPAIVVGSKRAPGAEDQRNGLRRLVTFVFASLLRVGFGLGVSDTHGMKALRREVVVPFAQQCLLGRDLFDTELILRVERGHLPVVEIPVVVEEKRPARTSILERVPRTVKGLWKLWWALR